MKRGQEWNDVFSYATFSKNKLNTPIKTSVIIKILMLPCLLLLLLILITM